MTGILVPFAQSSPPHICGSRLRCSCQSTMSFIVRKKRDALRPSALWGAGNCPKHAVETRALSGILSGYADYSLGIWNGTSASSAFIRPTVSRDPSRFPGSNLAGVIESASAMPTISTFYGILIRMFFSDHAPPHFHARYGEFEATVDIATLGVIEGQLPRRALNLVQEWR